MLTQVSCGHMASPGHNELRHVIIYYRRHGNNLGILFIEYWAKEARGVLKGTAAWFFGFSSRLVHYLQKDDSKDQSLVQSGREKMRSLRDDIYLPFYNHCWQTCTLQPENTLSLNYIYIYNIYIYIMVLIPRIQRSLRKKSKTFEIIISNIIFQLL